MPSSDNIIDPSWAIRMKDTYKLTWNGVGKLLARQQNRDEPYRGDSIKRAVWLFKHNRTDYDKDRRR